MLCSFKEPKHACLNIFLAPVFLILQKLFMIKVASRTSVLNPALDREQTEPDHHGDKIPLPL